MCGINIVKVLKTVLAFLGCCASYVSGCLTTFRDTLSVQSWTVRPFFLACLTLQDGTNRVSRNIGKQPTTQYTLRNGPEQWGTLLHFGGSLKCRTVQRKPGPWRLSYGGDRFLRNISNVCQSIWRHTLDNFIFRNPLQTLRENMKRDVL
jgi:hypothetical protein